jgi:hypothetical protein
LGVVAEGKEACEVDVVRGEVGLYLCDLIWSMRMRRSGGERDLELREDRTVIVM